MNHPQFGPASFRVAAMLACALACATALCAQSALEPTPGVGRGPNHRAGAPYRGKLSPPLAEGTVLVIKGHVRASDSGRTLSGVVLDAFHAGADGRYDMSGYDYRARVITDENGYYEFETVRPDSYGPPPHIHFVIGHPGYRTLSTELRFRDGKSVTSGRGFPQQLLVELSERHSGDLAYQEGTFDVVLAPDK